jgi:hypothetical protein
MQTTKYGAYGPYVSYLCFRGRYEPDHPRPYVVSERAILPWVKAEAARLQPDVDRIEIAEADSGRLEELDAKRTRILDNYEDGLIDRTVRDSKLAALVAEVEAIEVRARVIDFPELDWEATPQALNDVLTALFDRIEMDATMRPVVAIWRVPEWRA